MFGFLIRRLLQSILVLVIVSLLAFTLFRWVGDPVAQMVGQETSLADRAALRRSLGLEDPVLVQFAGFLGRLIRGDFGLSYQLGQPVSRLLAERLPATAELTAIAVLFAFVAGVPMGIWTALHRRRWSTRLFLVFSLVGISVPTFLAGILLVTVFGVRLGWLPTFGRGEVVSIGWWTTGLLTPSGWASILMPAATLGLFQLTFVMRLVRSEMLEVLRADFIRFARARGLPDWRIHFVHAFKNTLVSVVTVVGLQIGSTFAFAIVTESVFQWPGIGLLFLQAIATVDIPVMSTYLVMVALLFVSINFVVDVLYWVIDPRLRADASR